jgi:hypothetical protein
VSVATLRAHGIEARLPTGFEGRIFVRPAVGEGVPYPVAHFANFALPQQVADFGGGAVNLMGGRDIFAVLFEYGPESVGRRLFARQGMPRALTPADFRPYVLRRGLGGQSGTQWFFTEAGRPFTFYAVLGSHARRSALVPKVNALIGDLSIRPNGAAGPPVPLSAPTGARWN